MNELMIDVGLKNLVRHDLRHHGHQYTLFCDAFSQFGVAFPSLAPIGIGPVCPKATLSTYHVSNPTLELFFKEGATLVALQRQELECDPWLTTERARLPLEEGMLEVSGRHLFLDERSMISEFRFINRSDRALTFNPCWKGLISGEHDLYMMPYFIGSEAVPRTQFLECCPNGIIGGLRISKEGNDLPQVAVRLRQLVNEDSGKAGEMIFSSTLGKGGAYLLELQEAVTLGAGAERVVQFKTEINFIASGQSDFVWDIEPPTCVLFNEWVGVAQLRFMQAICLAKQPKTQGSALELKAWRARYALLRAGVRGLDGEYKDELACLCTSDNSDFSCIFFWDTLFSSVALTDFNSEYARGAIRTAFVRFDERDGSSPERKYNYVPKGRNQQQSPQSPVASWAVRNYLNAHEDIDFLAEMYPKLKRNHEFWEVYSDTDRDGLAEYRWSGQVCDNSPLWDTYASLDPLTGCGWIPPVASVALNCFLYWDAKHLVHLAEKQNLKQDVKRYQTRMEELEKNILEICYVPSEKRFWDYNHHTKTHRKVKTFYMFWPLFCGMAVPKETAYDLIVNVLLDPNQFFGEIPFPSVAYDEPTYNPRGYWRGRAWPHISYWLLQTLVRYGYVDEAQEAASRIIEAYSRASGYPENIATQVKDFDAAGFSDYNWGSAGMYLLLTEKYLQYEA